VPRCLELGLLLAAAAFAHDIPTDVTVQALLKPAGTRLQLAVRVPFKAIRDVDFPELPGGYLDVEKLAQQLPDAATVWIAGFVQVYEDGVLLPKLRVAATRIALPSDRSFVGFDEAIAHFNAPPLRNEANVFWNQVMFDVLLEYSIRSEGSKFSIRPGFQGLAARVVTVLRFLPPGGQTRVYEFQGDPGVVALDPSWFQAARRFVELGFSHILEGADHLLFLLCLVLPVRRWGPLLVVVTAFTAAHSLTLIASAYDLGPGALWFPPLIEALIAASIVYMALENIVGAASVRRRWIAALGFGLVHGFGFSFALRESLQFGGSHLLASLLAFNVGVELGQVLVLCMLIPMLNALFRFVVAERMGSIIVSALVAHTGWHWMLERWEIFRKYRVEWPASVPVAMLVGGAIVAGALLLSRRRMPR
jgi:hypothetical protein